MFVHLHEEARDQTWVLILRICLFLFLRQHFSLDRGLSELVRLDGRQALRVFLCLPCQHWCHLCSAACPDLENGHWISSSHSLVYPTDALPTEPPPWPRGGVSVMQLFWGLPVATHFPCRGVQQDNKLHHGRDRKQMPSKALYKLSVITLIVHIYGAWYDALIHVHIWSNQAN